MKTPKYKTFDLPRRRQNRGAALVIVLTLLILVTFILVGFFSRSITLRKSGLEAKSFASVESLADTAVNLVRGQIQHATTRGSGTSWASQPGAIRLFSDNGSALSIYKLYSATELTAASASDLVNDAPPANWEQLPAEWCDINQPAQVPGPTGTPILRFPILDPRDPANLGQLNPLEGFDIVGAPGATATQPAPMPVRWLYILTDGTLVAATPNGNGTVTVPGATAENPIAGRIAFWADDETSRLNINTAAGSADASDATFWDTPRFNAPDERRFGIYQPAGREYQRYPGHPATTSLGKVFPNLTSQQLLQLTPRYRFGGSEDAATIATDKVPPKSERLYGSVGELLFQPDRSDSPLEEQELESARFFLTPHSRSPEVTLFGTPRISVWPIDSDATKRTTTDTLLGFASTINGRAYHFKRNNPAHATADISLNRNDELLNYLDRLTQQTVPGFGGSFQAKYPQDRRDILVKIFDYIRCTNLEDPNLPDDKAFSVSGVVLPARHDDWDRVGFGRSTLVSEASIWMIALGRGDNPATPANDAVPVAADQVGEIVNAGNSTYWDAGDPTGRTPAAGRVAVQAFFVASLFDPSLGWSGTGNEIVNGQNIHLTPNYEVNGLNTLTLDDGSGAVGLGFPANEFLRVRLSIQAFSQGRAWGGPWNFHHMLFHGANNGMELGSNGGTKERVYPFYSKIFSVPASSTLRLGGGNNVTIRLHYSLADQTPAYDGTSRSFQATMDFSQFSAFDMPVPTLADDEAQTFGLDDSIPRTDRANRNDRAVLAAMWDGTSAEKRDLRDRAVRSNDVFWSLVPTAGTINGDYRLLARTAAPASLFQPHPAVADNVNLAFSSPLGSSVYFKGATLGGKIVASANYKQDPAGGGLRQNAGPFIPSGIDGIGGEGDWDNGFSIASDGPYINKADEGTTQNLGPTTSPYFDEDYWANDESVAGSTLSSLFSPNRMVPSAAMLGSLPTGVISGNPWRTLLFRPGPAGHHGENSPPDHLLLDLFWMPVAEPYAISEPFSTNGKVNLNYQIQPFTYIKRQTPLLSVLDAERVAKVGRSDAPTYKWPTSQSGGSGMNRNARLPLNLQEDNGTLRQFEEKFANGEIFRSATEICEIFLVPQGESWASDASARSRWYSDDFALVGDNVRERPYANLLGRVTTKSNTFTVYYTVQALKNPPGVAPNVWNESRGVVTAESRGSATLERYLDPNDPLLPDHATDIAAEPLDLFYRWRVVASRRFAP